MAFYPVPASPFNPLIQLMMSGAQTNDPATRDNIAHILASLGIPPPTRGSWGDPRSAQTPSTDTVIPPSPAGGRMSTYEQADPAMAGIERLFGGGAPSAPAARPAGSRFGPTPDSAGPPLDPRGPGGYQPVQAPGQYIPPPPGPQSQTGGGRTTGLPTGAVDAKPPRTTGITGADGGTADQPPTSYAGQLARFDQRGQPSVKDDATFLGEEAPGRKTADATDVGQAGVGAGKTTDPTDTGQKDKTDPSMQQAKLEDLKTLLGALGPPKQEDTRMPFPPLPGHESRFTPQDLMTMIATLSTPGTRTQPSSLGQLIGGGFR